MTKLEKLYSIIENSRDALWPDGRGTNGRCSRREVKQIRIVEGDN